MIELYCCVCAKGVPCICDGYDVVFVVYNVVLVIVIVVICCCYVCRNCGDLLVYRKCMLVCCLGLAEGDGGEVDVFLLLSVVIVVVIVLFVLVVMLVFRVNLWR